MSTAKTPKVKRGKPVNLYLREADRLKVKELMGAVLTQGDRVSESLIIRAAIHATSPTSKAFLAAYKAAAATDLRFTKE